MLRSKFRKQVVAMAVGRGRWSCRPYLEALESRVAPATHTWIGASPFTTVWSDPLNWSGGVPASGESNLALIFPASPHPANTNNISGLTITSIQFSAPNTISGAAITLVGDTTIAATNTAGTNTVALDLNQQPVFIGSVAHFNHVYNVAGNGTLNVSGRITGHPTLNTLHKLGSGVLTLTSQSGNNYGGSTQIDAGTLRGDQSNSYVPATSAVTVAAGATFEVGPYFISIGSLAGAGRVVLNAELSTGYDGTSTTFSGVISGPNTLAKGGNGTFTLAGANTYGGYTDIVAGTLRVGTDFAIPATSVVTVLSGATLDLQFWGDRIGSLDGAGNVINRAGLLWIGGNNSSPNFSGVISGAGGRVVKEGTGVWTVSGANTYTGTTTVSQGTVRVGTDFAVPAASAVTVAAGATLDLQFWGDRIGSLAGAGNVINAAGLLWTGSDNSSTTFSGVMSGNGGRLVKEGSGVFTLSGADTYTGSTEVDAGTLEVGNNAALGTGALTLNNASLQSSTSVTLANPFTLTGFQPAFKGSHDLTLTGAGTLNSPLLTLNTAGTTLIFSGQLSGNSGPFLTGQGTVVFSHASSYLGPTQLFSGTLRLAADDSVPPNSALTVSAGATLDLSNHVDHIGSLSGAGSVLVTTGGGLATGFDNTSTTFSGLLSGQGTLLKDGSGTLTLTGSTTYTGPTTVNGGTLAGTVTLAGPLIVNSGGTVSPGNASPGILGSQNATFNAGSTLSVRLNGTSAGTGYDELSVSGPADLSGSPTLNVTLGFASAVGDTFTILTSTAGTSGAFQDPAGNPLTDGAVFTTGGSRFQITYTGTNVVLTHIADPADHFMIVAPTTVTAGIPFDVTVMALDPNGNVDPVYTGTVTFTTSDADPGVMLPADYTFSTADGGVHTFTNTGLGETTLVTPGDQSITATDTVSGINGGAILTVMAGGLTAGPSSRQGVASLASAVGPTPTPAREEIWLAQPIDETPAGVCQTNAASHPQAGVAESWAADQLFQAANEDHGVGRTIRIFSPTGEDLGDFATGVPTPWGLAFSVED
jgi:autotransporter-associated beta strand protein